MYDIDDDQLIMSCLIPLVWILYEIFFNSVHPVFTYVTWEAETRIIRIGETVVLTCTVHELQIIDPGEPRQWSKGSSLVCYNGQPTDPLKYMESLQKNKFKLIIYNVTEADLNREYQCLYSFDTFSKNLKITSGNFEYIPPENTRELEYNYTKNGNLSIKLNMEKVFPLPNCTISFEGLQLTFANSTYKKNGLYFEVNMFHQSNHQLKINTQFNVTCKLLLEYVIASRIIDVHNTNGGKHVIDSDESSTLYDSDAFSTTPNLNESSTLPDSDESSTFPDLDESLTHVFVISLSVAGILTLVLIGAATIKFCIAKRQKRKRSYKDVSIIEMERIELTDEKDQPTINSSATEPILVDIDKEL